MHIPDGFIDAPTSVVATGAAVAGVGLAVRKASDGLDDRVVPLAGLTAAYVFAVQMLNFPVASGTSGHLLGGVLAAVLVGPWVGVVCMTTVLVVQALLFADGGVTAAGLNVLNLAVVGCLGGYVVFLAVRRVLAARPSGVVAAAAVASGAAVVLAAAAFSLEYAVGGAGGASPSTVAAAMIGTHLVIGVAEGVITAMTLSAVLATRPDLVHGARHLPHRHLPTAVDAEAVR